MRSKKFDVAIIGSGPAGLSAAIYTSRAGLSTAVFGKLNKSNIYRAHKVDNYFGNKNSLSGASLLTNAQKQAVNFSAESIENEIVDIKKEAEKRFIVKDSGNCLYEVKAVIICTGYGFKSSNIKNERQFIGKGVSYCVNCDGFFFKNKKIAVVGASNFAACEAVQLKTYSPNVSILSHGKEFDFSKQVSAKLKKEKINIIKTDAISEFKGNGKLEKIYFKNGEEIKLDGVFMALGIAGASDFSNQLGLNRHGPGNAFILIDPRTCETNVKGVYAAGDCTGGNAQVAKSIGEGCNAGISVIKFLKDFPSYVDYC